MASRVGVFAEQCRGRVDEGRHYFEPTARAIEKGIVKVRRYLRLRCRFCASVIRIETRHGR